MRPFLDEDFLLESDVAVDLYHRFAEGLPIIDFHCHLSPQQMASNHRFRSITEIWLEGDHYKWRAMRTNGVSERFCTGDASDWEKFEAWARTVPDTLRSPLYHWVHMELRRPFGIDVLLSPATARAVYDRCNERLREDAFTTLGLLRGFKVAVVCTTDDPTDSLEPHRQLAARHDPDTRVYPTWRPDRALAVEDPQAFNAWVDRLEQVSGIAIGGRFTSFLDALKARHDVFHDMGCRASDHGLETIAAEPWSRRGGRRRRSTGCARGETLDAASALQLKSALLHRLALLDHARGWVQQYHLGALRNNNTRLRRTLGPDTGFDSIGDFEIARPLVAVPGPAGRVEPAREDHPLQPEPARQRPAGDHDRQLPGRQRARQDAVRVGLVVPRSARRDAGADGHALEHGAAGAFRRHGDRLAQLPVVLAARVLPAPAVQPDRRGRAAGAAAGRPRGAGTAGGNVSFYNARDYFGFTLGRAAR